MTLPFQFEGPEVAQVPPPIDVEEAPDIEILATVVGGRARLTLAARLLTSFGSLHALSRAAPQDLRRALPRLGRSREARLRALFALAGRLQARPLAFRQQVLRSEDVYRHFNGRLEERLQEVFLTVLLDARHRVIGEARISQGSLTASIVHPREVFRPAIRLGAGAVILVHNHPSGDPTPSPEDVGVTRRLRRAGEILGIRVVDHVIVAREGYFSFQEGGYL
jgi:DNA repair protein RadC